MYQLVSIADLKEGPLSSINPRSHVVTTSDKKKSTLDEFPSANNLDIKSRDISETGALLPIPARVVRLQFFDANVGRLRYSLWPANFAVCVVHSHARYVTPIHECCDLPKEFLSLAQERQIPLGTKQG